MISLGLNEQRILNLERSMMFFLSPFRSFIVLAPYQSRRKTHLGI